MREIQLEYVHCTSVSVLGLSIKLKPAVLLNSGEFWGETADQNRGGFEHMQMTQSVILFRHESLCVRFLRYSDRKLTNGTVIWKDNRLIIPVIRFKGFSFRFNILTEKFYVSNVAFWPSGARALFMVADPGLQIVGVGGWSQKNIY